MTVRQYRSGAGKNTRRPLIMPTHGVHTGPTDAPPLDEPALPEQGYPIQWSNYGQSS